MTTNHLFAALLSLSLVAGCGGHSGSETDTSATTPAPIAIRDLSLTPVTIPSGKASAISGELTFDAPDGDVAKLAVDVTLPTGATQSIPSSDVPGAKGLTAGPLEVALLLAPPLPGAYVVTVRLVDDRGGRSNALTTTITAE